MNFVNHHDWIAKKPRTMSNLMPDIFAVDHMVEHNSKLGKSGHAVLESSTVDRGNLIRGR